MNRMPTWEEFNLPVLKVLSDGKTRSLRQLYREVADLVPLSEDQKSELLPSGELRFHNRVGWASWYLVRTDALRRPSRGQYAITELGHEFIQQLPNGITVHDLKARVKEGKEWWLPNPASNTQNAQLTETSVDDLDPIELVEKGIAQVHQEVASELLHRLQQGEPAFFEQAVVDLLVAMGYGGATGRGSVTQLSNDGGIDGVIDQDVLGLSKVYIQAKRYADANAIGRPEIQSFVGAIHGKANSGVFITTSRFSTSAEEYVLHSPMTIVLIDGKRLTDLMIRYTVGVQIRETHHIVEIDEDFFE